MDLAKIKTRGLTRREIFDLEADGIKLAEVKNNDWAAVDRLLDMCCEPRIEDKDALTPGECLTLFARMMDKTFLPEADAKNSGSPPS
jgi:hypothetical protein